MTGLLVTGTSSDAGKSLIVAGLCRIAARRGIRVTPYKAQNMSNNSVVSTDDSEIARAQWLQALASGIEPNSAMNPVLLKPGSDRTSTIVLRGKEHGVLRSGEYTTGRKLLAEAAWEAYDELASAFDLVICEGAGSPAEINLREGDYTNMGLAREKDLPVVLVGDIDRGGVLASIYGTWGLLDDADRALLAGYLINKFRGDQAILDPGLATLTERTGLPCFGVLPWLPGAWLDGEDSLEVGRWRGEPDPTTTSTLRVAAIRLPRIANSNDFDPLAHEQGVVVQVTDDPAACRDADLVVLPASRALATDLAWLRERGLADLLAERAAAGRPVVGIGSGFHLLGATLEFEDGPHDGLGLLPVRTRPAGGPVLRKHAFTWDGHEAAGHENHEAVVDIGDGGEPFLDGVRSGQVWGTSCHGVFEADGFRREFLAGVAEASGSDWQPTTGPGFHDARLAMLDTVADALEEHCRVDELLGKL